ncbi:UNVERIFIED_CONTAM: hypothetical protein Slati_2886800 [Sesamum latifolium]|uniref:Uncharacterized protein n=1 Tax=Sesamum latifolium TaxID=2727402 RepID=A0AAW2VBJ9_9LAMI
MTMLQTPLPVLLPSRRKILLKTQPPWRGRSGSETSPSPAAATDSTEGGVPGEGKPEGKDNAPTDPPEGPSNDPPAPAAVPEGTPPSSSGPKDPEDPACGEKN